jgi:hypothetical protein
VVENERASKLLHEKGLATVARNHALRGIAENVAVYTIS